MVGVLATRGHPTTFFKKKMEKIIKLFLAFVSCICIFTSCDTEGDEVETGFYQYSFSFFYPEEANSEYEFTFNGIEGRSGVVSRSEPDGLLEITEVGSGKSVFSKQISLAEQGSNIQFIKLGETIDIYSEERYVSFTPTVIYSGDASQYSLWFNEQELQNGILNYLSVENLTGNLQIRKVNEASPVFSQEMTIEANSFINLMQISDMEFLNVPEDTEPEPTDNHKCKVRLYYPSGVLDAEEIRVDFYAFDEYMWDWASELPLAGSVTIKQGEISDYVEFTYSEDGSEYISYMYSITNTATDQKYVDYMTDYIYFGGSNIPAPDGCNATFKKVTYQMLEGGRDFSVLEGLTTRW